MQWPRTLTVLSLGLIGMATGCGNDHMEQILDPLPDACFDTNVEQIHADCAYWLTLRFDASCSSPGTTEMDRLEVRWDVENDGVWDTPFSGIGEAYFYEPSMSALLAAESLWTARCQVRDEDGNVAETTETFPIGPMPQEPDIIAGRVSFQTEDHLDVDMVRAGEVFGIGVDDLCWGELDGFTYKTEYFIDGDLVYEQWSGCDMSLCGGHGKLGFTLYEPGEYSVTVTLDASDDLVETDELNNSSTEVLLVAP